MKNNKKTDDFFASFGMREMSEEELKKRARRNFEISKKNPENMSYWLPKIQDSTTKTNSILKLPLTKIVQLDFPTWHWLRSDNYTDEKVKEFNDSLVRSIEGFLEGEELFMKTGIFSDKFCFYKTIIDHDRQKIGSNFLDMYYNSMIVGAHNTSEVVFREFVDSKENVPMIYRVMPLHTEFRVFYDYDEKKTVGVSNYWHPEIMENGLHDEKDRVNYSMVKDKLVVEYEEHKAFVIKEVEKFMQGCSGLMGRWSVDVMKNGDDYWLIDMARMERSALLEVMEEV